MTILELKMNDISNPHFIRVKYVALCKTNLNEEEHLYAFTTMPEVLSEAHKLLICFEPGLLKSCLKPTGAEQEPKTCYLVTVICNTFSCQKFSSKIPAKVPKHVHLRFFR